jgi:hypothetical protein
MKVSFIEDPSILGGTSLPMIADQTLDQPVWLQMN